MPSAYEMYAINVMRLNSAVSDSYLMSLAMRKPVFAYAKPKTQISCAVTAQLISAFVFAT